MENHVALVREVLYESLGHAGAMMPLLFAVFLLMEFVSHGARSSWIARAAGHRVAGPIAASGLGLLPQCGFSVAATVLWARGLVPTGSLIASYIATSDEAIPVLFSNPSTLPWVLPLVAAKFVWGALVGIVVNFAVRPRRERIRAGAGVVSSDSPGETRPAGPPATPTHRNAGSCVGERAGWKEYVSHALGRTGRTATMVFVLASAFSLTGQVAGPRVTGLLLGTGLWQPLAASVFGLIPSCATSVAIAEGFRAGFVSFPALLSGLTANAGMGLLVLAKESGSLKRTLGVVSVLVASALVAGLLASLLMPS